MRAREGLSMDDLDTYLATLTDAERAEVERLEGHIDHAHEGWERVVCCDCHAGEPLTEFGCACPCHSM